MLDDLAVKKVAEVATKYNLPYTATRFSETRAYLIAAGDLNSSTGTCVVLHMLPERNRGWARKAGVFSFDRLG